MSSQLTLDAVLERAGKLFQGTEVATQRVSGPRTRYKYADFYRRARALGEALVKAGLRRGDRVGTLMWNHATHLEALFGIPAAGGVVHTLNHRLHANDLGYVVNHAEDRFAIVDEDLLPLWWEIQERVDCRNVIVVARSGQFTGREYEDYETFLGRAEGKFSYPSLHENEAAVLCYTTGTAGSPKGVAYSHRAIVLHSLAMSLPDALCISQNDVVMPLVPFYHANAWGLPYAATIAGCRQVFAADNSNPDDLLSLMTEEQVTLSAAVPIEWMDVLHRMEREPARWNFSPNTRILVSGAAPPPSLIRDMDHHGIRVVQGWGLVESSPLATVSTLKPSLFSLTDSEKNELRASQGLPLPFVDVRSFGDEGPNQWDGRTLGEVQIRGPWVTASYYNLPELRGKWTEDGWFRTGDVGTIDSEGYLHMTDRAKDLIRYGNDWISSVDLENELMGHPAVKEAAVVAVQHPKWQERPLAAVVLEEGARVTSHELREFLAVKFAPWQLPDAIVFVTALPHTPTGKLLKKEVRKQFKNWKWDDALVQG